MRHRPTETLTVAAVRELLDYNPMTGDFTWRVQKGRSQPGQRAGHVDSVGYRSIAVNQRRYRCHRLAWFYTHGEWPAYIDHKDGDKTNNAISNLRPSTMAQNLANSRRPIHNTSGIKGVSFHKKTGRWRASIMINQRAVHLGMFDSKEDAGRAYRDAAMAASGEFARWD